jgi:hypothetical protein
MAFEPRIVRPDDFVRPDDIASDGRAFDVSGRSEAEDIWLPDELQELAAQLSADATRLTDCCWVAPVNPESGRAGVRHWVLRIGVAAAILVASAGLWMAGRGERPKARPGGFVASNAEVPVIGSGDRLAQTTPTPEGGDQGTYVPRSAIAPAVLLDNLTGPEREGVLDLLEQQALEPTSISI